ncbi:MAG: fasciclin domain-containing protein [Algicola sp.]|nr:fasciclin domain-containing protein [Algicola sp.]
MKIISKTFKLIPVFLLIFSLYGCSSDDDSGTIVPTPLNIVELASANPNLSSLVAALQAADGDLVTTLSGSGPYTVLAPTNDAFDAFLGDNELQDIPTDVLRQVLLNHVISADLTAADLAGLGSGYTNTNASGAGGQNISIYFDTSSGGVDFNGVSSVVPGGADIDASNGTIHVVDAVIGLPSIVDHASANNDLSSLVAALSAADLVGAVSGDSPLTILAPNNTAFNTFLDGSSLGDVPADVLNNLLLNHVITGAVPSSTLTNAGSGYTKTNAVGPEDLAMTANNLSLYYDTSDGVRFNGVSSVAQADIVATNGIIHVVDAVIDIPSIVTFATADPNFSTLVTALTDLTPGTDFVATLSTPNGTSPAPFTVFAPVNSAFDALAEIPAEDVLTLVLLHHVLGDANVTSENLTDGTSPTMLNGQSITINLPGSAGNIADITDGAGNTGIGVIAVDVQAGNGVIHVLDTVMLPAND